MENTRRIRLLLVDDNPALLRQVVHVLSSEFEILAMLESGDGLLRALESCEPDVIVLDVTLPGQSGIALASQIRTSGCPARIVFLTVHNDADYVRSTMAVGASGYVVKMRLSLDLEPALRAAFAGERFISPVPELSID
jgi:DNA-binding NarL/FixJ family response regulator